MNTTLSHHFLSEWIHSTVQNVVVHTTLQLSTRDDPEEQPDENRFKKLIDGGLYNEKLINTYPWTILGFVLVLSGIHWAEKVVRWRRRTSWKRGERYSYDLLDDGSSKTIREEVTDYGSASSSGSSTFGSNTPSIRHDDGGEHMPLLSGSRFPNSTPSNQITAVSRIKAFLVYQPRPIPYFNKVLPSNGSSIFILSFLALNISYTFYNISFTLFEASVLGDRAGLIFGVNLPLLYILGAKNQPLKVLTGVSYESLNIIHRRLGELIMVAALIHASAMFVMWGTRTYVGWALAIFLVDRLVYRLCAKSIMAEAKVSIYPDNETLLLTFNLPKSPTTIFSQSLGHSISSGWKATDHVFLTIPSLGRSHALQAHPFTIASPAPLHSSKTSNLALLIRARSGFSADLLRAAQLKNTLKCRLDGPYGSSHARCLLEDSDLAVLVAGGSGIAVTWPIIHHLLNNSSESEDPETGALPKKRRRQRIVMVWIIHKSAHLEWIDEQEREDLERKGVEIIIPGATMEVGRPDLDGLMEGVVRGSSREAEKRQRIGVVVSGPDGLNRTVNNKCAEFVREGRDLEVTIEKFGW
ncbi:hypothetical protein ACHAO1_005363 [Botrytis cinerea]